jgi:acyl-CoA synthetase (AMP-forming)/AMP-acid ligase II
VTAPASPALDAIREHARAHPTHPALCSDRGGATEIVTYAELVARFDAGAAQLRASGLARGDRCGLVARQGAGFIEHALAILAAGGCLVPIPDDATGPARDHVADTAQLQHLVAEDDGFKCRPWRGTLREDAAFRALDPAYLRFTSGTTSERKGVVISHARIAERLAAANQALAIGPDDRVLWLLPMAHHFVVSILLYLRFGATILLPGSSLARPVLEFAARERATVSYASPFHYSLLAKDASGIGIDLRLAVSTAEGLRAEIAAGFRARFGRALAQALGIIEVGLPVLNAAEAETKPTALGRPLPAYDVWLRDESGARITDPGSPERTGEICIRGPGLFDAYLSPWTPSGPLLASCGFRTGDQGWFDADGTLFMAGRRHNRINMAGMKFFCEEVEDVIARVPGVRECRVIAREHAQLGEIPVAEIVPDDPAHAPARSDLIAACRAALPTYKVPREFRIVEALARTATGKVQR